MHRHHEGPRRRRYRRERPDADARLVVAHVPRLIIDGHVDTPQRFVDEGWQFPEPRGVGQFSLDSARAGNLGAAFFAAWAEPVQWRYHYAHRTLALIDSVHEQVRRHPESLCLCTSPCDILAAHTEGRFALLLGIEGGHSIENDLGMLTRFHRRGVRYMTLTWSNSNAWADSSGDLDDPSIQHHGGLTDFGRQVVGEMNRLGMMVDVSHASDATFSDVLVTTRAPVIASHSSARALTTSSRNLTDAMLRQLSANGGIAMVNFFPAFIDEAWRNAWNAQHEERSEAHRKLLASHAAPIPFALSNRIDREFASRIPRAPLASLIDHFDHSARVAGIEHVGIGTDFDGIPSLPEGIDSAADLPKVFAALKQRGYSETELDLIGARNLLRVFAEVLEASTRCA